MSEPQSGGPPATSNDGKFQPGRSGNLKGRPRKATSVGDSMLNALNVKVTVNEGGKRKKVTKRDAAATQLANMSASGDLRGAKLAFDFAQKAEERAATSGPVVVPLTASDREIVQRLVSRLRLIKEEPADEPDHA